MSEVATIPNGTPGGGPKTEEGKEVARWNSTRHGIRSPAPVVPGLEEPSDWQEHLSGVLESLSPEGHLETVLAERVALLSWRLHRVTRYETAAIAISQEKIEDDIHRHGRLVASIGRNSFLETHPEDIRGAARYHKQEYNALRRFPSLMEQPEKVLRSDVATTVVYGVLSKARERIEELTGEEVSTQALFEDLPGMGGDADDMYELPAMKVSDVLPALAELSRRCSTPLQELLEAATQEAGFEARGAANRKEEMEQEVSRKQRERILPDDQTLQKVARYEAHLWRGLSSALHELEALQTKRQGGHAPLARLDVQGVPSPES
jgi:hypothetical protein